MSGRNNRIVRNRERNSDFSLNSGIFKIVGIVIVAIFVVFALWKFWKAKDVQKTICLAEGNNISYEYFVLSTEEGIGVIDKKGNPIIDAKYTRH